MIPSNGVPHPDREPVPGARERDPSNPLDQDRLEAARDVARRKIMERVLQQAVDDLSDPALVEELSGSVDDHVAALVPAVSGLVRQRIVDRLVDETAASLAAGPTFEAIVEEAARRAGEQIAATVERVGQAVSKTLVDRVMERLDDTDALAAQALERVPMDGPEVTRAVDAACAGIERSVTRMALQTLEDRDAAASVVADGIADDHPALGEVTRAVRSRLLDRVLERALEDLAHQLGNTEARGTIRDAAKASWIDREPEAGGPAPASSVEARHRYVYGILATPDWEAAGGSLPDGVEPQTPVRGLRHGDVVALVSDVPADVYDRMDPDGDGARSEWMRERLRRHAQVLGRIGSSVTVLPMPFGTVHASDEDVMQMLDDQADRYRSALERLDGKVEWTVRMTRDEQRMFAVFVDTETGADAVLTSLPDPLATAVRDDLAGCDDPQWAVSVLTGHCVAAAHDELTALADAHVDRHRSAPDPGPDGTVFNQAYLVRRDTAEAFRTALERLSDACGDLGVGFEVSGPWPPYHFVDEARPA